MLTMAATSNPSIPLLLRVYRNPNPKRVSIGSLPDENVTLLSEDHHEPIVVTVEQEEGEEGVILIYPIILEVTWVVVPVQEEEEDLVVVVVEVEGIRIIHTIMPGITILIGRDHLEMM